MYENITPESVKADMLDYVSDTLDIREGSYTNDMLSGAAYEIWKIYQALNAVIPIAFVDETSGEYIDKRCAEYGITRKAGTKAKVSITFTGTDGTAIPAETVLMTGDGLSFITQEAAVITDGTATVEAEAEEIGANYNVAENEITQQIVNIYGVESFSNEEAKGGTDQESDESLVNRLYTYLRHPATSGNVYQYEQWALETNGVGGVKVIPLAAGPGTVKIIVVDGNKEAASAEIVENCKEHIEENRPIGATVTVVSAGEVVINISAVVQKTDAVSIEQIENQFIQMVGEYIRESAFQTEQILYNRIVFLLLSIDGVIDYTSLLVNGGTANISISEEKVAVLGTVEVS